MLTLAAGREGAELAPLRRLIIDKTEGNPFFMEEIVQALFEQGALVRNGVVKLTRAAWRASRSAHGSGPARVAHRPVAGGRRRSCCRRWR